MNLFIGSPDLLYKPLRRGFQGPQLQALNLICEQALFTSRTSVLVQRADSCSM